MAESREKSEQLRKAFEKEVRSRPRNRGELDLERIGEDYRYYDARMAWEFVQWSETIGREAGRRDALEEQWISVEEKLPEPSHVWKDGPHTYSESSQVLALDTLWGRRVAVREGSGGWSEAGGDMLHSVTHWQELPEPPKAAIRALEEKEKS